MTPTDTCGRLYGLIDHLLIGFTICCGLYLFFAFLRGWRTASREVALQQERGQRVLDELAEKHEAEKNAAEIVRQRELDQRYTRSRVDKSPAQE